HGYFIRPLRGHGPINPIATRPTARGTDSACQCRERVAAGYGTTASTGSDGAGPGLKTVTVIVAPLATEVFATRARIVIAFFRTIESSGKSSPAPFVTDAVAPSRKFCPLILIT